MYTQWANDLGATFKIKSAWLVRFLSSSPPATAAAPNLDCLTLIRVRSPPPPQHPDSLVIADPSALGHIFTKVCPISFSSCQLPERTRLLTAAARIHHTQNTFNYPHSPVFEPLIERIVGKGLVWVEEQSGRLFFFRAFLASLSCHSDTP
jgi:hypothetical protein